MVKYTVPAIHHLPTNTYMMDSANIQPFIESTYPDPPVPLTSELGREIEARARACAGPTFLMSTMAHEPQILSPRSQEYFRRTREQYLGHALEDLLEGDKEDKAWEAHANELHAVGQLLLKNKADGPFVLGARPCITDFFIAGALQCAKTVEESVFEREAKIPGYLEIYEACVPFMERKD